MDRTLCWVCTMDMRAVHSHGFRLKEFKEPSHGNHSYMPQRVDMHLSVLDKGIGGPAPLQLHRRTGPSSNPVCREYGIAQTVLELCQRGPLVGAVDALTVLSESPSQVPISLLCKLVQRCGSAKNLMLGRRLDDLAVSLGYESNALLGNHLLRMYACQARLQEAMKVFRRVAKPSAFMWSSIIFAHAKHRKPSLAVELYYEMRRSGVEPDNHIFAAALQACAKAKDVESGRQVHADMLGSGIKPDSVVSNCLLDMYVKCGQLEDARKVFDSLATRDVVAWTAMINGFAELGFGEQALALYEKMEQEGLILANGVTFACLLKACASAGAIQQGRQLHSQILEKGLLEGDFVVGNCLVNMYVACGELEDARRVFDSMSRRDVVTWNTLIKGYSEHGLGLQALTLYARLEQEKLIIADSVTFVFLLKACAMAGALQQGRQLHSQIVERGLLDNDIVLGNCLIDMYVKCGELQDAGLVFDCMAGRDALTWAAMINGYSQHGLGSEALTLYRKMEQQGLIVANSFTIVSLLKACASAGALQQGRQLHSQIVERGLLEGDVVVGNSLVDMYVKCGELGDARRVFDSLASRNVVTWTAMINGYAEHGLSSEALSLYARMEHEGLVIANGHTFVSLLKACASAGALQQGRQLHAQIVERGLLEGDVAVGNCLVNMYAKCGRLDDARMVLDSLVSKNVVTWTAMINGYGTNNEGEKAIACFNEMLQAEVQPDHTTFTCLLVACSQEGLVRQGRQYFDAMVKEHGFNPTIEHYICMVDLLGRAGHLDEAEKMLFSVGCKNNAVGLMSLLNACKYHGDIERGKRCFESLVELDPQNAAPYVLMANTYADADRWIDVARIERLRKSAGASKKPAVAGIEVNQQVHTFVVGEERGDISSKVRSTILRLKEEGNHVPRTKLVLKPLSEKEKEDDLCGHAEKLALAYGLLNTPAGTALLVTKTLRMCRDCHSSTETLSRIEKRNIVVRDAHRVHRFEAGHCSCKGRC